MPTIHVTPGSDLLLQEIANSLHKAKKVVVVTGAGISTNSGIPDFRSENGLYSLIQAQFDAASRELEKRAEERDAPSSPPLVESIQERPTKRRKLSVQDEISVQVESETPDESSRTSDGVGDVADQQSPRGAHSSVKDEDQPMTADPMTVDEGPSIIVAGDEGSSIRVASQDVSGLEESIVVLGDGAITVSSGGASCESPGGISAEAPAMQFMSVTEQETRVTAVSGSTVQTPTRRSPGLPPRPPKDDLGNASQPTFGPPESAPVTNLSSSPRASTPRISHLSSEIGHPASYPFSSSPLSSPPPVLSDPYERSSLEPAYSQSESISAASVSSSTDGEETDQTEEDSGSSTPYLTSQSSCNSSQSKTTLPNLKGRDLFDASIWADPIKTSVFYTFATTLRQKARDVAPTTSHQFLGVLRDRRKLVRCYTQNIDRLEDRIGLSTRLELGAGSRARFSAKAWRNSGASGNHSQRLGPEDEGRVSAGEETQAGVADQTPLNQPGNRDPGADRQAAQGQIHDGLGLLSGRSESAGPGAGRTSGQSAVADPIEQSSLRLGSTTPTPSTVPFGPSQSSQEADEPDSGGAGGRGEDLVRQRGGGGGGGGGEQQLPLPNSESDAAAPPPAAPPAPTLSAPNRGVECVFLHGSLESLRCFLCGLTSSWDDSERELETLAGRQPTCPHCAGATAAREERGKRALGVGKLRPDIVLYGEEHPRSDLIGTIVQHDLSLGPDMLLILGTSLRVHGLKTVVREFAKAVHSKGGKVVFVNFTKPPDSVWSDVIDFWVQSDCDAWVLDIKTRKPALWLPPGTELEDEETKPSRSKRTSTSGSTSIRRESSGLSLSSEKISKGTKRKSNGTSTKLKRKDSGLSTVQESISVSRPSTSNNTSIDFSPIPFIISDEPSAEQSIAVERPAKSRGRRPPHSLHVRQAFDSMDASDQADGRSRFGPVKVEEGDDETKSPKKLPAKRARKSLPTGSGLRPAPNREFKLNPNAKRPQAVRDEVQNGAHLSWKILEDLKRLTGQPKPSFIYAQPPPPAPKVPRSKKPRKSAPAALCSEPKPPSSPLPSEMAKPLPLEEVPPFSSTQHFAASSPYDTISRPLPPAMSVPQDTELVTQLSAAMSLPLVEGLIPNHPSTMPSSSNATSEEQEVNAESIEAPPQPPVEQPKVKRGRTTKPKPKRATVSLPAEVKTELPEEPLPPTSTSTIPAVSPGSIGAAIKRNPRKRKRKTIDGVEVMLPTVSTRVPRPSLGQPQTPPTQTRHTALEGYPPLTPHIMLPPLQPSITPVTPRFAVAMELQHVQQGLEDGTLQLPRVQNNTSPETAGVDKLEAMEPEPILGPLPVSNGPRKLAKFFADHGCHHQTERELTPFAHHPALDDPFFQHHPLLAPFATPGLEDPFFLHNPLLNLPYQSRAASIVPSRASSPDPSEQLKSEQRTSDEEAALTLSMIRQGVTPAVAAEYLFDRRLVQHGGPRPGGNTAADDLSRTAWLSMNCG